MKNYDDKGYNLGELRARAIAEGKENYAKVFTEALVEAAEGNPEKAEMICNKISGMLSVVQTYNNDPLNIALVELDLSHVCDLNNPGGCE